MNWPVERDPIFGCDLWLGRIDHDGYPLIWRGKSPIKAYIVVWEAENGPVPEGMVLDHRCRRRRCVRHVSPTTQSDNLNRRKWRTRTRQALCAKGHDAVNAMVTPEGGRLCRLCDK